MFLLFSVLNFFFRNIIMKEDEYFIRFNSSIPLKELMNYYFNIKPVLKYKEIVSIINRQQNMSLSLTFRTFKRICAKDKLKGNNVLSTHDLQEMTRNKLCTSFSLVTYRQMTEIIKLQI